MRCLVFLCAVPAVLSADVFAAGPRAKAAASVPDFTKGDPRGNSHDWTLGPTGARGWIHSAKGRSVDARQILVTEVAKGSPADGVLQKDDVILGVDGQAFGDDARIQFARAVTAAEEEAAGGRLSLLRWRAGKTETVELRLKVMGRYSETAPFDCPKSARVFDLACEAIAKAGLKQSSIANDLNALALLAGGKPEYRPLLAEYAAKVARVEPKGYPTWRYGYAGIFLAEYVLATGDRSVSDGLRRIARETAVGQSRVGTWGHNFARPTGGLNGYGAMNLPGLGLTIAMVLAREAGVKDPVVDRAIERSAAFLRYYVHKGAPPYGDHEPWPGHEDNGKSAMAAVLFDLLGDREAAEFFAKMSAAGYEERERGHTGCYFNYTWALLGTARCGPVATGAYFREQSWYYDLARKWDGSVAYQGSPLGEEEHNCYTNWDCTGSYLLALSVSRKSLHLTGRKGFSVPPLDRRQADEVIAAGRDYFPVNGRSGYDARTTEQLLAGLSSWSPAVRKRSAAALGRRNEPVTPRLQELVAGGNRDARYGAVEALGRLGPAADPAAPQLRALLKDADPWLQSLAALAIPGLGPKESRPAVPDLLALAAQQNPSDPRRMAQRYAAKALFNRYPGQREPQSLLAGSLDGVDRGPLYSAIRSVLKNDDPAARGTVAPLYGKLTDADLVVLLPDIVAAVEELAPTNEMFGDGVRLAGLDLLSRLRIREGLPLCVSLIEPARWGEGNRLPKCLACLVRYGAHAKAVLPQLREVRAVAAAKRGAKAVEHVKLIDQTIAKIEAAADTPPLVDLRDFKTRR